MVYRSKGGRGGKIEKAFRDFESALRIASPVNWRDEPFWNLCSSLNSLAQSFRDENKFDDATIHISEAESRTVGCACLLCRAVKIQAKVLQTRRRET